jgi:hypothetical protein
MGGLERGWLGALVGWMGMGILGKTLHTSIIFFSLSSFAVVHSPYIYS